MLVAAFYFAVGVFLTILLRSLCGYHPCLDTIRRRIVDIAWVIAWPVVLWKLGHDTGENAMKRLLTAIAGTIVASTCMADNDPCGFHPDTGCPWYITAEACTERTETYETCMDDCWSVALACYDNCHAIYPPGSVERLQCVTLCHEQRDACRANCLSDWCAGFGYAMVDEWVARVAAGI